MKASLATLKVISSSVDFRVVWHCVSVLNEVDSQREPTLAWVPSDKGAKETRQQTI